MKSGKQTSWEQLNTSVCCPSKDTQLWRKTNTSLIQSSASSVPICHLPSDDVTLYKDAFQITRDVTPKSEVCKCDNWFEFNMRKLEQAAWFFFEAEEKKKKKRQTNKMVTIPTLKKSALLTWKTVVWIIEKSGRTGRKPSFTRGFNGR